MLQPFKYLTELQRHSPSLSRLPAWLKAAALIVVGAAPFLTLQAIFDIGVTGHISQTPYTLYLQREQPGSTFGFHTFDPIAKGQSTLPQMRKDLEFSKTYFALHHPGNFWKPWLATQHPPGFAERPAYFAMIADTTLPRTIPKLPPLWASRDDPKNKEELQCIGSM